MTWMQPWEGEIGEKAPADEPFALPPPPDPPKRAQFGLRHIMILSTFVALVGAAVSQAYRTRRETDAVLAFLACASAFILFGFYLTQRLVRWTSVGWMTIILGLLATSIVITGWLTVFIMPVAIGGIILLNLRKRALEQDATLWVLALAAERNRPLGPAVTALARQSRGIYQLRALRLAECLDHGMTLPDSLDFVPRSASATAKLLVRVGHESGALAEALRDAAESRSARPPGWQNFGAKMSYIFLILMSLQTITGFILYFITPKFEAIFKDFGINLPAITVWTIVITNWLLTTYTMPILLAGELLFMLFTAFAFAGYGSLNVPLIDRLFLRRHSILILRCLAMIVEGDRPIGQGLQILARWYPTAPIRKRLAGTYLATNQGVDWIEALRRYRLIGSADAALLDSARRVGNLPWALRELAEGSARKLGYRMQMIGQILMTVVFVTVGAAVGIFAIAYYYPLVILIEKLA